MSPALIISGRVPQEMTRLAKEYYAFYDGTHVKVIRYWYRFLDSQNKALRVWYRLSDRSKTPDWVLTQFVNQAGVLYSAVLDVSPDSEGKLYMTEFMSAPRDREEQMLRQWRRILEEDEEE